MAGVDLVLVLIVRDGLGCWRLGRLGACGEDGGRVLEGCDC